MLPGVESIKQGNLCREEHSKEGTFELRYMIKHHRKSRRQKVPDGGNIECRGLGWVEAWQVRRKARRPVLAKEQGAEWQKRSEECRRDTRGKEEAQEMFPGSSQGPQGSSPVPIQWGSMVFLSLVQSYRPELESRFHPCVLLGKWLHLCKPQFPHLKNGVNNMYLIR